MSERQQLSLAVPEELIERIAQRLAAHLKPEPGDGSAPPASPWLTFDQACEYLGLSRNSLYKLTAAQAIPVRKKQGGHGLRFNRGELDRWMDEQYPRLDRLG